MPIYVDDQHDPCIEASVGDLKTSLPTMELFQAPFGANTDNNVAWYYPVVFSKSCSFPWMTTRIQRLSTHPKSSTSRMTNSIASEATNLVHEEGLEPERKQSTKWTESVEDYDLAQRGAPKAQ